MAKERKPVKRGGHDHPYFVERRKKDDILKELAWNRGLQEITGDAPIGGIEIVSLPKYFDVNIDKAKNQKEVPPLRKKSRQKP